MPRQVTASHNESHFSLDGNHRQSQSDSSSSSRHTRPIARYKNQSQWDLRGWEDGEPERRPPTPQNRGPPSGLSARRDQRDVSPCRAAPASNAHNAASVSSLASALQARGEGGGNAKAASFTPHCHPTTMTHAMNAACERHGGAASNGPARPQNAYAQQEPTVFDDDASWDAGMPRRPPGRGFPSEAVRGDEGQYRRPVSPQPSQQMPPRLNFNFSQPNFRPPSPQQQRHASPQPQQQRQQPGSRQAEVDDRRQQQPQQQPQQQQQQQQQQQHQQQQHQQPGDIDDDTSEGRSPSSQSGQQYSGVLPQPVPHPALRRSLTMRSIEENAESDFSFTTHARKERADIRPPKTTSVKARARTLNLILKRWCVPRKIKSCCHYHTVLDSVEEVLDHLFQDNFCDALFSSFPEQCPRCSCMNHGTSCSVCGLSFSSDVS